jgi:hypothetical protein
MGALVAWTVSGCMGDAETSPTPSAEPSRASSPSGAGPEQLPRVRPWRASPNDIAPQVKVHAARFVEASATWSSRNTSERATRTRLAHNGFTPRLGDVVVAAMPGAKASAAGVVTAQYGGYSPTSCSVLIVFDQWLVDDAGQITKTGSTWDVRLELRASGWDVVDVNPAHPGPPTSALSKNESHLLANSRVTLPFAARADIRTGNVAPSVVDAIEALSADYRVDVSVLISGHPTYVFDTTRISDHTRGRAVDVWAFDGVPVVDRGDSPAVRQFMRAAAQTGAYQVGGPSNPDGLGTQYFSDLTHHDHIHIGFQS